MENLAKDTRVAVTETDKITWMGTIKEVLWNVKPPKRGMTKQGYRVLPEKSEFGGEKVLHHSQVKKAKSKVPLQPKKRK